jgi:sec-independent protein translocase protein TatB
VQTAAQEVENTIQSHGAELDAAWNDASDSPAEWMEPPVPHYHHPGKNWRLKVGATPHWYKARQGVRTKALSGAARVARFRPAKVNG